MRRSREEPRHLSALRRVPLLRACVPSGSHAHASWVRTRLARRDREERKKKAIVVHPHCIIYGVSLLSPSAGVRPRDPYSGATSPLAISRREDTTVAGHESPSCAKINRRNVNESRGLLSANTASVLATDRRGSTTTVISIYRHL